MSWPLYLAFRHLFPRGRLFPFFTLISTMGVALGVMLMVMSVGIMGGAGWQIRKMIRDTQGDVQVRARAGQILDPAGVMAKLKTLPEVAAVSPVAFGKVMLKVENRVVFPDVSGYQPDTIEGVSPNLQRYVFSGSLDELDDDSTLLSRGVADQLQVIPGQNVTVYTPLMLDRLAQDSVLLPTELRVAGWYEVGHQQLDKDLVIMTFRRVQELYGLGGTAHGINVRLVPGADLDAATARINSALAELPELLGAQSWQQLNAGFLSVLQFEKYMIFFLLTFIVIVAAFSVTSSLLISVVRKTREIGILSALGGRPRDIAICYCSQGLLIGTVGTAVGLFLGFSGLALRDEIVNLIARLVDFFTGLGGTRQGMIDAYGFITMPVHVSPLDLTLIIVGTISISALAGLLPAWRAAKLKPVEALRAE